MNEPQARKRLESVLRPDEAADDLVLLLRGGVHREDTERLKAQAAELNRRFSFRGADCYGISVFAATSESEAWVLAKHMDVRRRYYRVRYADVVLLEIVPTFATPHWTVMFSGPAGPDYQYFVDALGDLRENPYWSRKPGRRHG